MIIKNLYYFIIDNNTKCYSLTLPEDITEYTLMYRLVADEGKVLTKDNNKFYSCIDITQEQYQNKEWQEIDKPEITNQEKSE